MRHGQNIIGHKKRVFNGNNSRLYSRLPRPYDHRFNTVNSPHASAFCTFGLWNSRIPSLQISNQQQANQHHNQRLDAILAIVHYQRVRCILPLTQPMCMH